MAAGDFSNAQHCTRHALVAEMWQDARSNIDPIMSTGSLRAVAENQRINQTELSKTAQCKDLILNWLKYTAPTIADCATGDCDVAGPESESLTKTYSPNFCKTTSFSVMDDDCNGVIDFNTKFAELIVRHQKALLFAADKQALSLINSNLDTNAYPNPGATIVTTTTSYYSDRFDSSLIATLALTARMNHITNPIIIDGRNMFQPRFNAMYNNLNITDKDQLAKFNFFPNWYEDIEGIDSVLATEATLLFDPKHFAIIPKHMYMNPEPKLVANDTYTYSVPLPGFQYWEGGSMKTAYIDVTEQRYCEKSNGTRYGGVKVELALRAAFVTSPAPADATKGAIKIVNAGVDPG